MEKSEKQESESDAGEIVGGGPSRDDISYNKVLLWHLSSISRLNTGNFYTFGAYQRAVNLLEIWLAPYQDKEYMAVKASHTEQWKVVDQQLKSRLGPGAYETKRIRLYSGPSLRFLEAKLAALVSLMHRKNLLLTETGEMDV